MTAQRRLPARTAAPASVVALLGVCAGLLLQAAAARAAAGPDDVLLGAFGHGDYASVVAGAPALLAARPNDIQLRLALADSYAGSGRAADAIPQYEELLGTDAEVPAVLGLSAAWRALGRDDRAEGVFEEARARRAQRSTAVAAVVVAPVSPAGADVGLASAEVGAAADGGVSPGIALAHDTPRATGPVLAMRNLPADLPLGGVAPVAPLNEVDTVLAAYRSNAYPKVARTGPAVLAAHPDDAVLRLAVANSLAWTGALNEAIATYEPLRGTADDTVALIGIANCWRWMGRPDRAAATLAEAQQNGIPAQNRADFDDAERYTAREIRPTTRLSLEDTNDTTGSHRLQPVVTQTWRDASNTQIYEVHADAARLTGNGVAVNTAGAGIAYENIAAPLAPRVELGYAHNNDSRVLGDVRVELGSLPWYVDVGRVDWGETTFAPGAVAAGLMATRVGLRGSSAIPWVGALRLTAAWYGVSDGNREYEYNAELTPAWQPLSSTPFKWFVGTYGRKAKTNTPLYWSPSPGFYVATAGIKADWSNADWQVYGALQGGVPLNSASSTVWGIGGGIRRWIDERWSVGGAFSINDSSRNDSRYRSNTGSIYTERRW